MDLNEWLRGERHWAELLEFLDEIHRRSGSRYRTARMHDPVIIEAMATAPETRTSSRPRMEDFTPVRADLADIKDLLWRNLYAAAHADPKNAPTTARPEMPWEPRRAELMSEKSRYILSQLLPWEVN